MYSVPVTERDMTKDVDLTGDMKNSCLQSKNNFWFPCILIYFYASDEEEK